MADIGEKVRETERDVPLPAPPAPRETPAPVPREPVPA